jgi:hypothetical protein
LEKLKSLVEFTLASEYFHFESGVNSPVVVSCLESIAGISFASRHLGEGRPEAKAEALLLWLCLVGTHSSLARDKVHNLVEIMLAARVRILLSGRAFLNEHPPVVILHWIVTCLAILNEGSEELTLFGSRTH